MSFERQTPAYRDAMIKNRYTLNYLITYPKTNYVFAYWPWAKRKNVLNWRKRIVILHPNTVLTLGSHPWMLNISGKYIRLPKYSIFISLNIIIERKHQLSNRSIRRNVQRNFIVSLQAKMSHRCNYMYTMIPSKYMQ